MSDTISHTKELLESCILRDNAMLNATYEKLNSKTKISFQLLEFLFHIQ